MTGRSAPRSRPGVHTLRVRQSSSLGESSPPMPPPRAGSGCGAHAPYSVAGRTPFHGATGCGGRNRRGPTGGAANGTPRKTVSPPSLAPCTAPVVVCTIRSAMTQNPPVTTVWFNPKCSKCRTVQGILAERGVDADYVQYLEQIPTRDDIERVLKM